jgi:hypothetical protein
MSMIAIMEISSIREKQKKNWKNHALFSVMRNEHKKQKPCLFVLL